MINKRNLKVFNLMLVISMLMSSIAGIPFNVFAMDTEDSVQEMTITEDDISKKTNYDTYYYSDNVKYLYDGQPVSFTSNETIEVNGQEMPLKNKKTEVSVEQAENKISISLSNLSTPVNQIPGDWNSSFGGEIQVFYHSNIPGMEEIRSNNLTEPIVLEGVEPGEYELTNGTIFEKANEWSPGTDFKDGQGVVKERNFGTLPNIHLKVSKEDTSTTPSTEEPTEGDDDSDPALPAGYLGTKTEAKVYDDFGNDLWLQYQQKALEVNETVDLRPWRVEQIVSDGINNDVARPNFHFEVISGDSVTLSDATSTEKSQVKAVKPGTSVVKVTYDELEYKGKTWGAISPVNTAYAVFVVGQDGKSAIKLSDELMNWRHYDTIYYSKGETVPYTFNVDAKDAKKVRVLLNGVEITGNGNEYTANLENRSNIISVEATDNNDKVSSLHRVVDARFIEVNVENKTNPKKDFIVGDTAKVSFKGINLPVYKLATIYNPTMNAWGGKGSFVEYKNDKSEEFKGRSGQYDLATKNSFEVEFKEAGNHTFTSPNGIFTSWWGSKLGSDLTATGPGEPNLNADVLEGYFSKMPDFNINVKEEATEEPKDNIGLNAGYLGTKTEAKVYNDFENDLWLQYQQKSLKTNETVDLRPWRVEQIVSDVIANDVARPNFHFEVISGDSVTLSEASSTEKTQVKAVKPGTSVVKVTYDALTYKDKVWGKISPVNTGYIVYSVDQKGTSNITLNDELMNWRHYDTIYYNKGETTPYNFTVDAKDAKAVRVLVNGVEVKGEGNKFTANLENRSNIISVEATDKDGKISSLHRIVDARFINVNVENKTAPNKDITAGDTATVSFKGITLPVYKLATIYNPTWYSEQWGSKGSYVEYENDKLGNFKGRSGQYDLTTKNSFDIEFKNAGDYTFKSPNGIFTSWWGSKLGSDLTAAGPGEPNLNADVLEDYFSKMPDFKVLVKENTVVPTISLNKDKLELTVGKTEKVTATVTPESEKDKLSWTSSNEEIATVAKDGTITAKKAGEVDIKASIGKVVSTVKVTVKEDNKDKELNAHKEATNKSLATYKDAKDYRKTQQDEITSILKYSDAQVNKAKDKAEIDAIAEETKAKLDAIKTEKQLTADENKGDVVTFSLEKFTIGQGFIVEPVKVPFKKNENVAQLFDRVAKANKLEYWNAGSLNKNFYLQGIENVDNKKIKIPAYIPEKLNGPTTEEALATSKTDSDLGEFDYNQGSGWYYLVNGTAANVGMSDWEVKPNQVVRVAFTLVWGEDLSGTNFGEGLSRISVSNKDDAMTTLADFNGRSDKKQLLENSTIKTAYDNLNTKVQDTIIAQIDINKATADFKKALTEAVDNELQAHKDASKKSLAEYKDLKDYRKAQQDEINAILKDANGKIDKAADKSGVDAIVKDTKGKLDTVKTDKELTDAEKEAAAKELQAHKDASKKSLAEYKDLKGYRKAQQDEINAILKDANGKIDKAADKAGVDVIVKETKAKLDTVKTDKELTDGEKNPQGPYIKDGRFVTITKKGYNTWSNFGWKKRDNTDKLVGETYEARGKYKHENGSTYLSLYDNKGKWQGYLNETAVKVGDGKQGAYISDGRFVTITKKGYSTWSNFGWKKRDTSSNLLNETFQARGRYKHFNGSTYVSLYDNKGKWHGYININAVKVGDGRQGAYISDGRFVTISKGNYETWSNFNWKKRGMGKNILNQTFQARGRYKHFNGSTYVSLYDNKGNWHGYININAVKVADGKQGAYIKDGRKVTINKKGYNTWSNFNWKKRSSTTNMMGKTFTAKGRYSHYNGDTYYSLYDNNGKWHGYVNKNAVK
ncbi:Ig-like domain-containing protein [Vagococcus carniphilus]|uniref:Ig-like domain-containing protein n=1 Tax=Vagococcus carniphilus TaxID=218144 RepID=A0AAW8U3T4_9ENTE|nr:Ig-like domain-containing protein [Vagococcus carniphilus]MDT2829785.1 Ig-like domain-containing protein [Vagococcus carniphilus]MDT2834198.1 Ig-like domain-containing protein [Vagococcus carniphilus]MDT2839244.1 Ig-like domain-containing protein [Vagococcus carniphilus]MDT2853302.1 Ig-like domain-containing protein [Vagococcus carniphilus]